jgi:hypothetical protein
MVGGSYGSVWKNENTYYYFDQLGYSQLIPQAIYRIHDQSTVAALFAPQIRTDDIRNLVDTDHMIKVKRTELVEIKTKFSSGFGGILWIIVASFIGIQVLLWVVRKLGVNMKPLRIRNQELKRKRGNEKRMWMEPKSKNN